MTETYSLAEATMKVIQDRRSIREWTEEPIRFPRGGAVAQVHFAGSTDQAAASLPELSPGARAELGWPPPAGGSTKR
jgi:hypothetical protein